VAQGEVLQGDMAGEHRRGGETFEAAGARPEAGIGIVNGAISGPVVVDIDARHGTATALG
jgi:hypothetical protein